MILPGEACGLVLEMNQKMTQVKRLERTKDSVQTEQDARFIP